MISKDEFYPNITTSRGFLPIQSPLEQLPSNDAFRRLENIVNNIPELLTNSTFRGEVRKLPLFDITYSCFDNNRVERPVLNRLRMLYSYIASAYIHGNEEKAIAIPKQIAVPLFNLSKLVKRPPIMSYADYSLNNWRQKTPAAKIELDNLDLLVKFNKVYDEDWFILIHVAIEAEAGVALSSMYEFLETLERYDSKDEDISDDAVQQFDDNLRKIYSSLKAMNAVLNRLPEKCSPEVYYKEVRPYIFGFDGVIYEGISDEPRSFRGETGAQSSILPALIAGFGINHQESVLTKHLVDMRQYMPYEHRNFLSHIDGYPVKIRDFVEVGGNRKMTDLFNDCIDQIHKFRSQHFQYAMDYIYNKTANPKGTGGTDYAVWLKQLANETLESRL